MRKTVVTLSLVVCVAFVGSMLLAQDAPKTDGAKVVKEGGDRVVKAGGDKVAKEGAKGPRLGALGNKIDKAVGGLSDEQKAKIAELNKKHETALKELNGKFMADVLATMTDEQKAKWEEAQKAGKKGDKGVAKEGKGDAPKTDAPK